MNITRDNYEEFFMLYADNELTVAQKNAVDAFIAANPDLQQELALFRQFKLSPDAAVVFTNKELLIKQEEASVNISATDYESFFVLYADDELTNNEKAAIEDFVYRNPQLQGAFELLQQVKLSPDAGVVFENKESLYRKEKDDKTVPFRWWRLAAAAAIIFFVSGVFWLSGGKKANQADPFVKNQAATPAKQPSPQAINETAAEKNNTNEQVVKETIGATGKKDNQRIKTVQVERTVAVTPQKEINPAGNNLPVVQGPVIKQEIAALDKDGLKNAVVSPINERPKKVEIKRDLIAAAGNSLPDQPAIILNPDEDNKTKASFASLTDDNVEVLNTSVNTKSSLRGFLRKASRLIAKKTNAGNEDGNHKNILIGGFEIAVR